ncbi:class I SAM-dependent methyltransferase [Paenibacillus sp. GSMTC-2017]|uniref:class I SAM-dependent methyltransferase n=1 Tax=Paenibacillus sp. GSMTC-2017 TaxID=2794350 RepID=UPI0018D77F81|nr:class I SAM-dependent methyltransferase [Paenibacillus sp. GSMTC-2017]MBH5316845.1 class I SAM-dependent methyltransferase [Paenibacillus sp. GSMTC-2017]
MSYNGFQFYDNETNFEKYMERRAWKENANDTLEKPVVRELLGEVSGKKILDLGCGDAKFAKELFDLGCENYIGIEGSTNMIELATESLEGLNGAVIQATMEDWEYPESSFDLVISRLALHYIEDIDGLFKKIHQTLKPNGVIVFSIEHPVITSTLQTSGTRTSWTVDNYFIEGFREQQWLGGTVHKYHRSIEGYYRALQGAGFTVENLRESTPHREHFENEETYERRLRIPLFLFLSAKKTT